MTPSTIDLSFEAVRDPGVCDYFMNLPTSFSLPQEEIDNLIALPATLLRASKPYQEMVSDLTRPVAD